MSSWPVARSCTASLATLACGIPYGGIAKVGPPSVVHPTDPLYSDELYRGTSYAPTGAGGPRHAPERLDD